jgi:hypothetical protein
VLICCWNVGWFRITGECCIVLNHGAASSVALWCHLHSSVLFRTAFFGVYKRGSFTAVGYICFLYVFFFIFVILFPKCVFFFV